MCVCVEDENTGIPVCLCWRPALRVFFTLSPPQILRSHLSVNLELTNLARLAGQKDRGISLFSLLQHQSIGYFEWLVGIQTQDFILAYQMLSHPRHLLDPDYDLLLITQNCQNLKEILSQICLITKLLLHLFIHLYGGKRTTCQSQISCTQELKLRLSGIEASVFTH